MKQCAFAIHRIAVTFKGVRDPWYILRSGPIASGLNMAWDQALLEFSACLERPTLRFYAWTEPAATFGYFQRYADIAPLTPLRPLIRRSTGGGLVPHDRDWTYAIAVPPDHAWYSLSAIDSYQRAHTWLQNAFAACGATTELAPCCDPSGPGQCFVGAEKYDLLHKGRKIAGAAQRRNKLGLLIQGSVQPQPRDITREAWEAAMLDIAAKEWRHDWAPLPEREDIRTRTEELAVIYGSPEHNERR